MHVWSVGDSMAFGYSSVYPVPIGNTAAVPGSAFVARHLTSTISENVESSIGRWGVPENVILLGSTNDATYSATIPTTVVEAKIVELTNELVGYGISVHHVTEPAWTNYTYVNEINEWLIATYPDTIDCAPLVNAGGTSDGIHPINYTDLASCIYSGV